MLTPALLQGKESGGLCGAAGACWAYLMAHLWHLAPLRSSLNIAAPATFSLRVSIAASKKVNIVWGKYSGGGGRGEGSEFRVWSGTVLMHDTLS